MNAPASNIVAHTAGPWYAGEPLLIGRFLIRDVCGDIVAEVTAWDDEAETSANARLIAAAPELLAAVKAMLDPDAEGDVEQAIRAIGKAEGTEAYAEEAARIIDKAEGRS